MMGRHMEERRLTRSYLDTLTNDALAELADEYGLGLPEGLNRLFVIEELLDAGEEESAPVLDEELQEVETAAPVQGLPDKYNRTSLGLLIRDPLWAYAFWEVKPADREAAEADPSFVGYRLRVVPLPATKSGSEAGAFTVSVGREDSAWYLCLPGSGGWFRVELCAATGKGLEVLAASDPARAPRGRVSAAAVSEADAAVLNLSGLHDLRVLNVADKQSRVPTRCES